MQEIRKWIIGRGVPSLGFLSLLIAANAQSPIPGKFYEYYTIARTGTTFTSLGNFPSINYFGDVAFEASTSAGNGLWYGSHSTTLKNFNPGESFSSSDIIQPGVQMNGSFQVVSEDRITTTTPATTSIRLYNGQINDSFSYIARGGPSRAYNAVFANPATNEKGDVVFTADNGNLPAKVLGYVPAGSSTVTEQMIFSGNPKAVIANNGTVAITVGGAGSMSTFQLRAYVQPFSNAPIIIADTNADWVSIDNDPGISRDGHVIVFQGNPDAIKAAAIGTTTGAGIFAAIDTGTGFNNAKIVRLTGTKVEDVAADIAAAKGNKDGVCDTAANEICKPAAELGFDASGSAITFASYPTDSRVGVVNVDFGAPGIANDSFVVSFLATPSGASRANPALPGIPLLFSSQLGLWTIRVDVQNQLDAPFAMVFHPFTPIPVVQVGDKLGPDTITGLSVYDPIAPAGYDESGSIRTMRRGDHRVTFWASTNNGQVILRGNHLDSDQDGLLDHWETTGIDMDQDGVVDLNLSSFGANPFERDLFIQTDWVGVPGVPGGPFQPAGGLFSSDIAGQYSGFEANYRNAEALMGPMYGATIDGSSPADIVAGVIPRVDAGSGIDSLFLPMSINVTGGGLHGGNSITMPDGVTLPAVVYFGQPGVTSPGVNVRAFQDIRDHYFGAFDKNARLLAFHYLVFAPFQDFKPNIPATPQTNTITAIDDSNDIEITPVPSGFFSSFMMVTSGGDAGDVLNVSGLALSGAHPPNNVITTKADFKVAPHVGDTIVFLEASSGLSEVAFAPSPDFNSLPGNGVIVSTGALGVLTGAQPNQCDEWRTAGHEMGHDLGLRHGGTDHFTEGYPPVKLDYLSIMNYSYQFGNCLTSTVQGYSKFGDHEFDDYANLQGNFSDVEFYLTTSLGEARGEGTITELGQMTSEQTLADIIAQNGPLDVIPPTVTIASPGAGTGVPLGSTLTVNITATDNVAIHHVTANFDINGDGIMQPGEAIMATAIGGNNYQAVFPGVSGAAGSRAVSAIGWDSSSNTTLAMVNVNVGGTAPPPPANILASAGTPQSTAISTAFSTALQATVTNASSGPVAGAAVTFTAPGSGASGTFPGSTVSAIVFTNGSGVATAPTFTANGTAGGFTVTASVSGVAMPANFTLTNAAGAPPATPVLVAPANLATGVSLAASLSWNSAAGATSYDVYFGTASSPPFKTNTTATTYSPGTLTATTTYYWYVVAKNTSGMSPSATFSFTTQALPTALQFYPVAPCRLVDTRGAAAGFNGIAPFSGPSIAAGGTLTIPVQSATEASTNTTPAPCGTIPSTALSYSVNITVVPQAGGAVDYVSLWPAGSPKPFVSTLDDPEGLIVANAAIVPAGTPSGGISVFNAGPSTADVIIDMNGYFAAPTSLQFYPVAPCRLVDTRGAAAGFNGLQPFAGPSILAGGTLTIPVQSTTEASTDTLPAPCGVIPTAAQAYSFNLTVVPEAEGAVDYVSMWPAGSPKPFVSTLNDPEGLIVANAAIVPAGASSGGVSVFNAGPATADVILDMNGYFAPPTTALQFYPISPCRLVDTRGAAAGFNGIPPFSGPSIAAGGTLTIPVQSATEASTNTTPAPCGVIPSTAQAYSINLTVVPNAGGPVDYVSLWPAGATKPFVSTLDDPEGLIVSNAAIVPAGNPSGGISVFNAGPSTTDVIIDMNGYFAP